VSTVISQLVDNPEPLIPEAVAAIFHTTVDEIAAMSELSGESHDNFESIFAQQRLREILSVIDRVEPWCGSLLQAYAWFRSEPLPGFGDLTAEELVKRGYALAVLEYISRIAEDGYA